jgi:hypothetical protein
MTRVNSRYLQCQQSPHWETGNTEPTFKSCVAEIGVDRDKSDSSLEPHGHGCFLVLTSLIVLPPGDDLFAGGVQKDGVLKLCHVGALLVAQRGVGV